MRTLDTQPAFVYSCHPPSPPRRPLQPSTRGGRSTYPPPLVNRNICPLGIHIHRSPAPDSISSAYCSFTLLSRPNPFSSGEVHGGFGDQPTKGGIVRPHRVQASLGCKADFHLRGQTNVAPEQTGFCSPQQMASNKPGSASMATNKPPAAEPELRASCDRCWSKKRRCPGGNPCLRCRRGSFVCNYSRKRKLGRPAGSGSSDSKRKTKQGPTIKERKYEEQHQKYQRLEHDEGEEGEEVRQQESAAAEAGRDGDGLNCSGVMSISSPSFVCSSATGLAGLPESRFLSCFLEHYAPM